MMCHNDPSCSLIKESLICSRCIGIYSSFTILSFFSLLKINIKPNLKITLLLLLIGGLHPLILKDFIDGIIPKFIFGIILGISIWGLLNYGTYKQDFIATRVNYSLLFQMLCSFILILLLYFISGDIAPINIILLSMVLFFYYRASYLFISMYVNTNNEIKKNFWALLLFVILKCFIVVTKINFI